MDKAASVFVAGHRGLVGSAIVRRLEADGFTRVHTAGREELDLRDRDAVEGFLASRAIRYVFMAAAKVGGIGANSAYPADFIRENLAVQLSVLEAARSVAVDKLLFLGSSCIYPRECSQPIREDDLLTGPLEPTNQPYAIAKIAGIEMCQSYHRQYGSRFISLMPTNLYGPNDGFDLETGHVLPALVRKFHEAKESGAGQVTVWGTGTPRREFLHVDDLAEACVYLMERYDEPDIVNVGTGRDTSILDLARMIRGVVGFEGAIVLDPDKPDGTPRKVLDVSRLTALGWQAKIPLEEGIRSTYAWYREQDFS